MEKYLLRFFHDAGVVWVTLTIEILATTFLYVGLSISGLSRDISLLISFIVASVLVFFSLLTNHNISQGVKINLVQRWLSRKIAKQQQFKPIELLIQNSIAQQKSLEKLIQTLVPREQQREESLESVIQALVSHEQGQGKPIEIFGQSLIMQQKSLERFEQSVAQEQRNFINAQMQVMENFTIYLNRLMQTQTEQQKGFEQLAQSIVATGRDHAELITQLTQMLTTQQRNFEQGQVKLIELLTHNLEQMAMITIEKGDPTEKKTVSDLISRDSGSGEKVLFPALTPDQLEEERLKPELEREEEEREAEHPEVAHWLEQLAALYSAQGRSLEAEPLLKQVLNIREQELGPNHPEIAHSLEQLAALYSTQGKYLDAERLLRRALNIREKVQGIGHPDTAHSLEQLAALHFSQKRVKSAERLSQRAQRIRKQISDSQTPVIAQNLDHLAALQSVHDPYELGNENTKGDLITVRNGTEVVVEVDGGKKSLFKIVENFEANPSKGLISAESPVGKALIGHKIGDEITVLIPGGTRHFKILSVRTFPEASE